MNKKILSVALLALCAGSASAVSFGYCKSKVNRNNVFRVGTTGTQGQAICLTKAKLQAMKGKTIDFAEFAVGSRNTVGNSIHVFITKSLGGQPIAEGDLSVSGAFKYNKWTLDNPYTITGDEDALYIGFTTEVSGTYKPLIADGNADISGYNFVYEDGNWVDSYGTGYGSAYITVNVDGMGDYTDAIMGRGNLSGYFKAGNKYDLSAIFLNAGTTTITGFDAEVNIDGHTSTQHFDNLSIAPKDCYTLPLSGLNADNAGNKTLNVKVYNVKGGDEIDVSDNDLASTLFFYPDNMERSMLLEGFTGQDCPNCPSGHQAINQAVNMYEDNKVVEVSHHAGYYPDRFTMMGDYVATYFYGTSSTYAPAVMVNRYYDSSVCTQGVPVTNTGVNPILNLLSHQEELEPYVSLNLQTSYNKDTRELDVTFQIRPHRAIPYDKVLFNVFLTQDGIKAYQSSGGDNYTHHNVFRGYLTGSDWGIQPKEQLVPDQVYTWTTTVTIPEKIHSDFWTDDMLRNGTYTFSGTGTSISYKADEVDIDTDIENMKVGAFVGEYDTDNTNNNTVFNCCETKLGESYTQAAFGSASGVESIGDAVKKANVYVENGKVEVDGAYDSVSVYNLAGSKVDASSALASGVYLVKVVSGGNQTTKKILVK